MNPLSHVAIIMDGNGRWAAHRKKPRNFGHRKGLDNIKPIIQFCKKKKIKFIRSNVGDRYVKEKMQKHKFNLGGEQSGHIILGKFATTGDGLLVALEVLFSLRKGSKCSDFFKTFVKTPQILENIEVKDRNIINNIEVRASIKKRSSDCKIVRRKGRLYVINKKNPKFKQRQG